MVLGWTIFYARFTSLGMVPVCHLAMKKKTFEIIYMQDRCFPYLINENGSYFKLMENIKEMKFKDGQKIIIEVSTKQGGR